MRSGNAAPGTAATIGERDELDYESPESPANAKAKVSRTANGRHSEAEAKRPSMIERNDVESTNSGEVEKRLEK
jgi:hypothetical protein